MIHRLRHAVALLAVAALLGASGCGESGKAEGKATSTPSGKQPKPSGY